MQKNTTSNDRLTSIIPRLRNTGFVLAYHKISRTKDPLQPDITTITEFENSLKLLSKIARFVPAEDILESSKTDTHRTPAISLTFDDGYKDSLILTQPILRKLGIPCTIFITTGFSKNSPYFVDAITHAIKNTKSTTLHIEELGIEKLLLSGTPNKRITLNKLLSKLKYLPPAARDHETRKICESLGVESFPNSLLSPEEIHQASRSGIRIGAHTHRHSILSTLSNEEAVENIIMNRDEIRSITGHNPKLFAYPNGKPSLDFNSQHELILQALNFDYAFTSESRPLNPSDSLHSLPRYSPWQRFKNHLPLKILRDAFFRKF